MRVVVIGASLAGLFAAAATAARGAETSILERDRLPDGPEPRKGVPQGRQAHVLLHRGMLSASDLLPGLREELVAHGAAVFDGGTMPWLGEYGWAPTWLPSFEMVSVTRPLLEHVVRTRVTALPGVRIVQDVRAPPCTAGALSAGGRRPWNPPKSGGWQVAVEDGDPIDADVVIDASGRSSRMPHWLAELGVPVPEPEVVDAHLGYACRLYRASGPAPLDDRRGDRRHAGERPRWDRAAGRERRLADHRRRVRRAPAEPGPGGVRGLPRRAWPIRRSPTWRPGWSRSATSRSTGRRRTGGTATAWSGPGPRACWWSATPRAPSTRSTGRG